MIKDRRGTTLVEIVVSVAIIGILSSVFLVSIRTSDREVLRIAAEQLAADLRQIRNRAFSRSVYDMAGTIEYPQGGYGIAGIAAGNGYYLFAENGNSPNYQASEDELIKEVILNSDFFISKGNNPSFYLTFLTEHNISSTGDLTDPIKVEYNGEYINISIDYGGEEGNYWGNIVVGEIETG